MREKDSLATDRVKAFAFSKKPIITSTRISIGEGPSSEGGADWDFDFFDFFGDFSLENSLEVASRMAWTWGTVDESRNAGNGIIQTSRFSRLSASPQRH